MKLILRAMFEGFLASLFTIALLIVGTRLFAALVRRKLHKIVLAVPSLNAENGFSPKFSPKTKALMDELVRQHHRY